MRGIQSQQWIMVFGEHPSLDEIKSSHRTFKRLFHGVDCPLDRKGSRDYLVKATLSPNAAAGTQAMAHAMLVTWHIDHFLRKQSAVQRYMFAAAYHINKSARIMRAAAKAAGLKRTALPEVVLLHTGGFISRFTEQANELRWLCREAFLAEQEWSAEQSKENKKVVTKRLERPNRYKCANPECTIETTFGKVLKRCQSPIILLVFLSLTFCSSRRRQMR